VDLRPANRVAFEDETDWRKNRKLVREGFKGLGYLPKRRAGWNATLCAMAYSARRRLAGSADLNLWAAMHGVPPSGRYDQFGDEALTLWHCTSAVRAEKIREHGLIHKRGVWAATDPSIAHGYTRGRSRAFGAGSAMVVFVVSGDRWEDKATAVGPTIAMFHQNIPPECIQYILWSDRIEFVGGEKARTPTRWGAAWFKKQGRRWVPRSRPPVRFDRGRSYSDLDEWLDLSIRRILETLGEAAAVEVFSSLYATVDPWAALEHRQVFAALERLCEHKRPGSGGFARFRPRDIAD